LGLLEQGAEQNRSYVDDSKIVKLEASKKCFMDIYESLGVQRIISATGPNTITGGALMPREVVEAMVEASRGSVYIEELQAKASEVIAEITGAESGLVTTGAAAGLALATASCITGLDIVKMEKLPDTSGMKDEVIIPKHHRNAYDHQIRLPGAKLVEAGLHEKALGPGFRTVETWEVEGAITDKTAAIAYFAKPNMTPDLSQVIKIANEHEIPLIIDAAAELPPASNLQRFIALGASAVTFSGGKAIRGPQSSGILCGKKDLIMGAALQQLEMGSYYETWNPPKNLIDKSKLKGLPRDGIGRGFKAGKEEIVGLITALRIFASKDHEQESRMFESMTKEIADRLGSVPGICAKNLSVTETRPIPLTEVKFLNAKDVGELLRIEMKIRSKNPPVYLSTSRVEEMVLQVNPFNLQDDDIDIIVQRIREAT
jgi:L-seryl-tRNA(Ser) seleniumtransferase